MDGRIQRGGEKRMIAYYGDLLSPHIVETKEGFLICKDVPIARTGLQKYLAEEIGEKENAGKIYDVLRPAYEVFKPAAIASFEGKPVTDGHPPETVAAENYNHYIKGHAQNVRQEGDKLIADLYIMDAELAQKIKDKQKREISCGYLCNYEKDGESYKQTNIEGNHIAIVEAGRAGTDVAIKDSGEKVKTQIKRGKKMKDFYKKMLHIFGSAAKDATPEELKELVETTAETMDNKEINTEKMIEKAPKGDDIGTKLEKVIEMLSAMQSESKEEKEEPSHDETSIDTFLKMLQPNRKESAVIIEDDLQPCNINGEKLLKTLRPVIAAMKDQEEKTLLVDTLIETVTGKENMENIVNAVKDSAMKKTHSTNNYNEMCKESENAYAAYNPHTTKKGE